MQCATRSRVRFPLVSLEFFIDIFLSAALRLWVNSASKRNNYQKYFLGGWRRPVRMADNLTTFMYRLSWNLGASTSWKPQGLYRDCFTFTMLQKAIPSHIKNWTLKFSKKYSLSCPEFAVFACFKKVLNGGLKCSRKYICLQKKVGWYLW
jgi:hypothetical protein